MRRGKPLNLAILVPAISIDMIGQLVDLFELLFWLLHLNDCYFLVPLRPFGTEPVLLSHFCFSERIQILAVINVKETTMLLC